MAGGGCVSIILVLVVVSKVNHGKVLIWNKGNGPTNQEYNITNILDFERDTRNCKEGFYGEQCKPCAFITNCVGVTTCTSSTNQQCSICAAGWGGTTCEVFDACSSYPCDNEGTCVASGDGYNCTCVPGLTGQNCEIAIDECTSSPCLNEATCVDKINSYACVCYPGYTGINCQTDANECASVPCQQNGTCSDKENGYACSCLPGYSGNNCQYSPCSFYIIEQAAQGLPANGFITKVDEYGNILRITSSGDDQEHNIVVDGSLVFYITRTSAKVWRVAAENPSSTRATIWQRTSGEAIGIGISKSDVLLFVDEIIANTIVMLDYEGTFYDEISVGAATGWHRGIASDELNRIIYLTTDSSYAYIISVSYTNTGFIGNVAIVLSGSSAVGDMPTGLVFKAEERRLYWILQGTNEIRSMVIGSNSSEVVVGADNTIPGGVYGLAMCGTNFFHTSFVLGGGIWRASPDGGARVKITKSNTMETLGICTAG